MSLQKQNDAVFAATVSVLAERDFAFEDGMNAKEFVTKDDKAAIIAIVTQGIMNKSVAFSDEARAKHTTEAQVKSYVGGMVDNHFRKDKRLNGDTKYVTKNPGSRVGSQDEIVKNLRALKTTTSDASALAEIDGEIATRISELKALKPKSTKKVTINPDLIPESLQYLLNSK